MTFPSPSETFVANDVRALARLGVNVSVHALRGARADAPRLLNERGIGGMEVTHGTLASLLQGVALAFLQPLRTARLVTWVMRQSGGHPVHVIKGLALVPRVLALFRRLERDPPDVVHLYWGHYPSVFGWMVLEYAPQVSLSLSLSAYDLLRGFPGSGAIARRAHLVSTWAAANVPAIARYGVLPKEVHVSHQGIDLDKVTARELRKVPRRIVTAGRLIVEKGMDDVIRAFARVAAILPDARLVVLGDGPDRPRLERLAATLGVAGAVSFRGHVAHDQVFEELASAEVFLFLSRYAGERLPNVVKEAMASRCIIVTTATRGIEEVLVDGTHGRVVPLGAWEAAAEHTIEALRHPEVARAMGTMAQNHVFDTFDVLRLMEGMIRKWEECTLASDRAHSRPKPRFCTEH